MFKIYVYNCLYVFPCFWLRWVFTAARAFSGCRELGLLSAAACGLLAAAASLAGELGLTLTGSAVAVLGLSCSEARGIEPTSPVLAGGFLATAPPGKSQERPQAEKINLRAQRTQHSAFLQHLAVDEAPDPIQL